MSHPHREDLRKSVHLAMTSFALLLRWLTPWQAAALASAAILLNWVVLPLSGLDRRVGRDGEHYVSGVKLYPVGVLLVILLYPLPVAAAAWAALGAGDYASNVFGRRLGRRRLSWNPQKSWAGAVAFVLATAPTAAFLLWFTWGNGLPMPIDGSRLVAAALATALVGAALETLAIPRLDDNILLWVSSVVGHDLTAWQGPQLLATNLRELYYAARAYTESHDAYTDDLNLLGFDSTPPEGARGPARITVTPNGYEARIEDGAGGTWVIRADGRVWREELP